jgi:16S rRNA G966 N2-methylase RsmD
METQTAIILLVPYDLFLGSGQEGAESYSRRLYRSCTNASDFFVSTKPLSVQNDAVLTLKHVVTMNLLYIYLQKAAATKGQ